LCFINSNLSLQHQQLIARLLNGTQFQYITLHYTVTLLCMGYSFRTTIQHKFDSNQFLSVSHHSGRGCKLLFSSLNVSFVHVVGIQITTKHIGKDEQQQRCMISLFHNSVRGELLLHYLVYNTGQKRKRLRHYNTIFSLHTVTDSLHGTIMHILFCYQFTTIKH
jgi:hypothetical protein